MVTDKPVQTVSVMVVAGISAASDINTGVDGTDGAVMLDVNATSTDVGDAPDSTAAETTTTLIH